MNMQRGHAGARQPADTPTRVLCGCGSAALSFGEKQSGTLRLPNTFCLQRRPDMITCEKPVICTSRPKNFYLLHASQSTRNHAFTRRRKDSTQPVISPKSGPNSNGRLFGIPGPPELHSALPPGALVEIIQFGFWNREPGPDFVRAAVRVDGEQTIEGDIEWDMHVADWEHHGHSQNAAFDQVLLHVFLHKGVANHFTRTTQNREVIQVHLQIKVDLLDANPPIAHPGQCCAPL